MKIESVVEKREQVYYTGKFQPEPVWEMYILNKEMTLYINDVHNILPCKL